MTTIQNKIHKLIALTDKKCIFIASVYALAFAYFYSPFRNIDVTSWDRSFCDATLTGIDYSARIRHFYQLYLLYLPGIFLFLLGGLSWLFYKRNRYKNYFFHLSILQAFSVFVSYLSRYSLKTTPKWARDPMLLCILAFFVILILIAMEDSHQKLTFEDITIFYTAFLTAVLSFLTLFKRHTIIFFVVTFVLLTAVLCGIKFTRYGKCLFENAKKALLVLMWLPMVAMIGLEIIYFLTEKGHAITQYATLIGTGCLLFFLVVFLIVILSKKKSSELAVWGYIGAVVSFVSIGFYSVSYQRTWSYSTYSIVYEMGNATAAIDTFLYGKLPIIDYFSAHALTDVWTRIVYSLLHHDVNGVILCPYGFLSVIATYLILFYIVARLFDKNTAVLYMLFFPFSVSGIKWATLCLISVAALVYMYRKPSVKSYILFWVSDLIGAFLMYDEGISLGIGCILAYTLQLVVQKKWNRLKPFLLCGTGVGGAAALFYVGYALATGLPVISRMREWLSVSVGSNATWAISSMGDPASFAFILCYYITPLTAVFLLMFVLVQYYRTRKNGLLVVLTTVFAIAEILYIPRTMVFHNLTYGSSSGGVIFNYIPWTVSLFVLYFMTSKKSSVSARFFAWMTAMMVVVLIEGTAVLHLWPSVKSSLTYTGFTEAQNWDLKNHVTENIGKKRIVPDESADALVHQFQDIFDTLLNEKETFLDFANITSMYALTGRDKPCYVAQTPSLLTDLYSQECYLNEIEHYDCPLAVIGNTSTLYLQAMTGIPHNVRYYKIAEYIYAHYRPLVQFDEFVIWCETEKYDAYRAILASQDFITDETSDYTLVDYGYDFTTVATDENGESNDVYSFCHSCYLMQIPFIWANYDQYDAIHNKELCMVKPKENNTYVFEGSQSFVSEKGNYLAVQLTSSSEEDHVIPIVFYDSENTGAKFQYFFSVKPGTHSYLIRVSGDYFWDIYNIDTLLFPENEVITVNSVRILDGD